MTDNSAISADGTAIRFTSLGAGPGLLIVGGVLSRGRDYLPLARLLASSFEVHLLDRRGREGSGPQRLDHSIDDECADVTAVLEHTKATTVFGHSFGGLVALETARRDPRAITRLAVYEPGVPLRGSLSAGWLDGYWARLSRGDRRGAFAWMVKHNGFAPPALAKAPLWWARLVLKIVIRGDEWKTINGLLEANGVEHRIQSALDAPDPERFSAITAQTLLMGGSESPGFISGPLLNELAGIVPAATTQLLEGADHLAPQRKPAPVADAIQNWRSAVDDRGRAAP